MVFTPQPNWNTKTETTLKPPAEGFYFGWPPQTLTRVLYALLFFQAGYRLCNIPYGTFLFCLFIFFHFCFMDVLNEGLFDVLILPIISHLAFVVGDSSRPENELPVKRPFSPPITSSLVCVKACWTVSSTDMPTNFVILRNCWMGDEDWTDVCGFISFIV